MKMHLSTHTWMRPEPLDVTLERASRLGYASIELAGEPSKYPIDHTRGLLAKHHMDCWGAVTITRPGRDLLSDDASIRDATLTYMKDVVDMSAALGGSIVTVVPSTVGKTRPSASAEQEWDRAVQALKELASFAASKDIKLALEPLNRFETYFLNRTSQALALIEAIGLDNVGVAFDPYHLCMEEPDLYAAVDNCTVQGKTRIFDVHLGDNNRLSPGTGSIDWPRLMQKLKDAGYEGGLAHEAMPPTDRSPLGAKEGIWAQLETDSAILEQVDEGTLQFLYYHASGVLTDSCYTGLLEQTARVIKPLI